MKKREKERERERECARVCLREGACYLNSRLQDPGLIQRQRNVVVGILVNVKALADIVTKSIPQTSFGRQKMPINLHLI